MIPLFALALLLAALCSHEAPPPKGHCAVRDEMRHVGGPAYRCGKEHVWVRER